MSKKKTAESVRVPPKVGDTIYVPTHLYLSHGRDDVQGGRATVVRVWREKWGNKTTCFVAVREHPDIGYNWESLAEQQEELRKEFGRKRAFPDPDNDPRFNEP